MDFPKPLKVKEVASIIDAKVIGDADFLAHGLNELHVVREGDISFVDHPKYYSKVLNSNASIIIINKEVKAPEGKVLLLHDTPFDAFINLILHFRPFKQSNSNISPTATIGNNTVIQPGVFVGNNVTIGNNCIIHANVSIYDHTVIGDNVVIQSNSVIGGDAYYFQRRDAGFKKFYSGGRVIIEDNVEIGSLCTIDKGVTADTVIGAGTKFDNHCQVGHDTKIGRNCLIGAFAAIAGVTVIEDDVILWANVSINKDIVIGEGTTILATSAVDKSIIDGKGKVYMGAPAIEVREYWKRFIAVKQLPEILRTKKL
jgi:UDP-3-O-[3-hydroxymyristoyl] glucosamine N-acyltransferase